MPLYEYQCQECKENFEKLVRIAGAQERGGVSQVRQCQDPKKNLGLCREFQERECSLGGQWLELRTRGNLRHTALESAVR